MKSIINAAPGLVNYGVDDQSTEPLARSEVSLPQHIAKFMIYAKKGPSIYDAQPEQFLVGNERVLMYGLETFQEDSPYFNHQTAFSNRVNASGNAAIYVRILGKNYGPKPIVRIFLDYLPTKVDQYERNDDGSLKLSLIGEVLPIAGAAIDGYRVKVVSEKITDHAGAEQFGALDATEGDQVDPVTDVVSIRTPIFEFEHNFFGADGNLAGIRLWAMTTDNSGVLPAKLINTHRVHPMRFGVVRKSETTGNTKFVRTVFTEENIMVSFKQSIKDPVTGVKLYFGDRVVKDYQNLKDTRYPLTYGEFGRVSIYQENIEDLLAMFHAAEVDAGLEDWHQFGEDASEKFMFNFVTGTALNGAPYKSFIFVDAANSIRFTPQTNVFASGGSDGEMNNENFAGEVADYMERYADPDDQLQELAYHVETDFYDSGFPLDVKHKLFAFIAERKDTFLSLSPYTDGETELTPSEEYSIAQSLRATGALYPESAHFGTEAYRFLIMGCTGKIRALSNDKPYPVLYQVAGWRADYMGAGTGIFKEDSAYEGWPANEVVDMFDISIKWVPDSVRVRNWDAGLNWCTRYNREQFQIQALKTGYGDDTSILTSDITAHVFLAVNKALAKAQRTFSGISGLTPAQFSAKVNNFMSLELAGKFGNRVTIVPRAQFTTMDEIRGYSWTVPVDVYGENMPTVMTGWAVAKRRRSLTTN